MTKLFARFAKEEDGATAIEYGLIAAILSVAIIAAVGGVRDELNETFESVSGELSANNTP
jgi:pilus assembly protein Flp/PilA